MAAPGGRGRRAVAVRVRGVHHAPLPRRARRRARPGVRRPHRPPARQLPVLPPPLRRPDAQAPAPGRRPRLRHGHADQPQQPRARRRPGHGRDGEGRRRPAGRHVRAAAAPGAPDLQRHHREPRGALRRARVPPRQGRRLQRGRPLHARPHVPRARHRGRRRRHGRSRADGPRRARAGRSAPGASAPSSPRSAPPGSAPSTRCRRSSRWPARTASGCTSTPPTAASSR